MTGPPLRLIVFDVDGTLVDSQAHILAAMRRAFDACGWPMPAHETVLSIVGLSLPQAMARLRPESKPAEIDALVDAYKQSFQTLRQSGGAGASPLYPGAREVLTALLGAPEPLVGIATGKSRRGLDHVLSQHGLTGAFATEQVADHHPSKPHPAMLQAALADTGVDAAHAVMVGDTSYDMEMGRSAGLATIGVSWGYHPVSALERAGADVIIDAFSALPAALDRIWSQTA